MSISENENKLLVEYKTKVLIDYFHNSDNENNEFIINNHKNCLIFFKINGPEEKIEKSTFDEFLKLPSFKGKEFLMANSKYCPTELLDELKLIECYMTRLAIFKNKNSSPETLKYVEKFMVKNY